jgi:hypothetical protein
MSEKKENILFKYWYVWLIFIGMYWLLLSPKKDEPYKPESHSTDNRVYEPVVVEEKKVEEPSDVDLRIAYDMATKFVTQNIKTPSTAQFPSLWESKDHVKSLGDNRFQIDSWVDAQNLYGAMVRNNYTCIVRYNTNEDSYSMEDLKFSE